MANYNKSVNFAVKDTLQAGDPQKIVSGAEIDTEFNNISSSSTTKIDKVSSATTGNIAQFTAAGALQDSGSATTDFAPAEAGVPAGSVTAFAGQSAPSGWLECNGLAVSRTGNASLFSAIGTSFGNGDGSTTFNLPDLRGEFIRGWDNGRGVDSGRSFGSTQLDALQQMEGSFVPGDSPQATGVFENAGGVSSNVGGFTGSIDSKVNFDASLVARTADETRPRNVAMMYIIKA